MISIPNFLGQASVRIRGYAQPSTRGVATLWDGVSVNTYNLATADIERPNIQLNTLNSIEVIRGPGSVLYGTDAFHCVVSLESCTSNIDEHRVLTRLGTGGFFSSGYNGSMEVGKDSRLHVSISSSGQPDQNITYNYSGSSGERDYNYQSTTLVTKFKSKLNNKWSYNLGFYYDDNDSNSFQSQWSYPPNDIADTESDLTMLKAGIRYQVTTDSDLSLNTYAWEVNREFDFLLSATNNIFLTGKERRNSAQLLYRIKHGS